MKLILSFLLTLLFVIPTLAVGQSPACSTEKVNHQDCIFTVDRRYPVTFPTIQMAHGKKIIVQVNNPMASETLSLNPTSATLLPGTDQGAAVVTSALPNFKGSVWSTLVLPPPPIVPLGVRPFDNQPESDPYSIVVNTDLQNLLDLLAAPDTTLNAFRAHVMIVYAQLNQALSPIPRPLPSAGPVAAPREAPGTPNPWDAYSAWRFWMLCELVGGQSCKTDVLPNPTSPLFNNVLGELSKLLQRLPPVTAPSVPLFDPAAFDAIAAKTAADITKLRSENQESATAKLKVLIQSRDRTVAVLASLVTLLPGVQKDFQTYAENIQLATGMQAEADPDTPLTALPNPFPLDTIYDPVDTTRNPPGSRLTPYPKFLGRQVAYSVNAVNQISTSRASITASSAKVAITTITVIYADPRFEASAGTIFSFLHNDSYANQTVTTPPAGSKLTPGSVVISETRKRPEVIPFVAGNWRVFNDFSMPDHRRGAFYATAWLGINPYSALPEFGGGPSISWRAFMFSALYHRGNDLRLTPGEYTNEQLCDPSATAGMTPPPCSPAPAAPTTMSHWTNTFGIGISIRVPTTYTAGTGGVSH